MRRRLIGGEGARAARRRRWQSLREKRRRVIFLLPSLLTTANLFSGFLAVLLTANGRYADAAVAILAAILLDILDGKVARFNVYAGLLDRRFFVGLPTPAAAGLAAASVLFLADEEIARWGLLAISAATYVVAVLMVSTFRYWSFKEVDFSRRHRLGILLLVVLGVLIVATYHQLFLFALFGLYVLSGPARRLWVRKPESVPSGDTERKEGQ